MKYYGDLLIERGIFKMNIIIREERNVDYRRVEEITRAAFSYPGRIEEGGIGCPYEHWMVHELRQRDGIPGLSLVAEIDGTIVGHVICSKAEVRTEDRVIPVLDFGPISVLPGAHSLDNWHQSGSWVAAHRS